MPNEHYIPVGKLGKPHGISGAFRFRLSRVLKKIRKLPPYFCMEQKGNPVPFFVSRFEMKNFEEGLINFEEITTPEQAKQYSGSELLLTEKEIKLYFEKDAESIDYLIGYRLTDEQAGEVGTVIELLETPAQVLAIVKGNRKDYTIPLADDFIVEIDELKKQIHVNLPEGLLDL
ncbi:MAG: 16S rRNA processing protein RimM [Chitinophagales bacterium]|nr:16S rRNA processing protein RimM [Chitinophagales bacterium]